MKVIILIFFMIVFYFNSFSQQVEVKQLIHIGLMLQSEGYELTHKVEFDYLNKGESVEYLLILKVNTHYIMYATCDNDCGDIDLFLYDAHKRKMGYHDDTSDLPVISFYSVNNQVYSLKVVMYNCRVNPCKYGLAVYGK